MSGDRLSNAWLIGQKLKYLQIVKTKLTWVIKMRKYTKKKEKKNLRLEFLINFWNISFFNDSDFKCTLIYIN